MSAPVSVVIPTLDAAAEIGPCLAALTEGVAEGVVGEVILADGGSGDDIAAVADGTGARLVEAERGRGTQLRTGVEAARGAWLLVLHADTVLPAGWSGAVAAHMAHHPEKAAHFGLAFDEGTFPARLVAGWANLRSALFALPYGDQGLLIPRPLHDRVGGYPAIPLMEDVAIVRTIGRRRLRRLAPCAVTSAARYRRQGWMRRGWRNLSTLGLWFLGVPPERLAERYRR